MLLRRAARAAAAPLPAARRRCCRPPPRRAMTAGGAGAVQEGDQTLWVFDFDHTIVDGNTDTWITRAAPGGDIPAALRASAAPGQWTAFMQRVLTHLHAHGVRAAQLQDALASLPYTAGMEALLAHVQAEVRSGSAEAIIVSDSNSAFIDWILTSRGHAGVFRRARARGAGPRPAPAAAARRARPAERRPRRAPCAALRSRVYTNPATLAPTGELLVAPHHTHGCTECPSNLCKRTVLAAARRPAHWRVVYVGDGANDLCPLRALEPGDVACVRAGYALERLVTRAGPDGGLAARLLLVAACLALLVAASAAPADSCTVLSDVQTGTLKSAAPKGCLNEDVTMGIVEAKCFDSVAMNVTNTTGAGCAEESAVFNVTFGAKDCQKALADMGIDNVGTGVMTPDAAGGSVISGNLTTGQSFKGSSDPAGNFIMSVDGVKCDLTYAVKSVGKPTAANATVLAKANATLANLTAAAKDLPAAAVAAATTAAKSGASAAVPGALAVIAAALALAM
ncbi:PHOSPHO2 [Scenedesmus sp. PABB004]|nr:PHOSPHO2 [Scenedesmus sp. PABB004]